MALWSALPGQLIGQASLSFHSDYDRNSWQGGTCGIYALVAAAKAHDVNVNISDLLVPEFCDSFVYGSSSYQLEQAATRLGLVPTSYKNLDWTFLKSSRNPVLLLVEEDLSPSGHWITFLGIEDGKALIFDQAQEGRVVRVPRGDLLINWRGMGISIRRMDGPTDTSALMDAWGKYLVLLLPCVIVGVISTKFVSSQRGMTASFIISISIILAMIWIFDETHIFRNTNIAGWIYADRQQSLEQAPVVVFDEFMQCLQENRAYVIDTRPKDAYKAAHVDGSVNLAIDARPYEFFDVVKDWDRSSKCVVFCNSRKCQWANTVANRLIAIGFRDVVIFRGGMQVLATQGVQFVDDRDNDVRSE
ncbi:MAG TPA: rhodanese-like domain-containing protein [Pirellulaceae bacterium]|nr:rhodanese-like domain-containing protein [Pirellulaceae bacterium]HMO93691.1 rhodanese-like domain-containing protein [Pirellulaceae bacterium]HMP71276.1 rhodanese-like domain-containing protein [Pirellulaceae bacterium]